MHSKADCRPGVYSAAGTDPKRPIDNQYLYRIRIVKKLGIAVANFLIITAGIVSNALADQVDCPVVPHTDDEVAAAIELAMEVAPSRVRNQLFETTNTFKCALTAYDSGSGFDVTSEAIHFRGYFGNRSAVADATTRDYVNCTVQSTRRKGETVSISRGCVSGVESRLTFPGISDPVEVSETIPVTQARQVLGFFAGLVGKEVDGEDFTQRQFSAITRLYAFDYVGDKRQYYATIVSGCQSRNVSVLGQGQLTITFTEVKRSGSIC